MNSVVSTPSLNIGELVQIGKNYARGMWRYRWHAVALVWVTSLTGWGGVLLLEDKFEATAKIYVDTENALQPLLRGIATEVNVIDEVAVVTRELQSRPNLAQVARATDLDLSVESEQEFEQLLMSLQRKIRVNAGKNQIYTISFEHSNREKAVSVVDALVSTFVERSLGNDRTDSDQAQSFLQDEIAKYELRLTEAEDRLARFKRQNVEFMPGQRGDYFGRLQAAETALKDARDRLRVLDEQRRELQRQLAGTAPLDSTATLADGAQPEPTFQEQKLAELRSELEVLRLQYTDRHPRIGQILDSIEALEQQSISAQRSLQGASGAEAELIRAQNPIYQNIRIQLSNVELEMAALRAEERQHAQEIFSLEQLVDTVPDVEAELGRLNRDYGIVKNKYEQLVEQLETANIGDRVAESIDDIQFRIIEPPFAPEKPAGPNRAIFSMLVFLFAMASGAGLTFLLNELNPVFTGSSSVTRATGLPVLTAVSMLYTADDQRRRRGELFAFVFSVATVAGILLVFAAYSNQLSIMLRTFVKGGGW